MKLISVPISVVFQAVVVDNAIHYLLVMRKTIQNSMLAWIKHFLFKKIDIKPPLLPLKDCVVLVGWLVGCWIFFFLL